MTDVDSSNPRTTPAQIVTSEDLGRPIPLPWGASSSVDEGFALLDEIRELVHDENQLHEEIDRLRAEDESLWRRLRKGVGGGMFQSRNDPRWRARRGEIQEALAALREQVEALEAEREKLVCRLQSNFVPVRALSWSHLPPPEPRSAR